MVKVEQDDGYDFKNNGTLTDNANQWRTSNMHISSQETVLKKYDKPVSLTALDSIYRTNLALEGIDARVVSCITDSLGNILKSSLPIQAGEYGLLKTNLYPISNNRAENLQAFIVNPGNGKEYRRN